MREWITKFTNSGREVLAHGDANTKVEAKNKGLIRALNWLKHVTFAAPLPMKGLAKSPF